MIRRHRKLPSIETTVRLGSSRRSQSAPSGPVSGSYKIRSTKTGTKALLALAFGYPEALELEKTIISKFLIQTLDGGLEKEECHPIYASVFC